MARRRGGKVVPFSRDYRKPPRWRMGEPGGRRRRSWRSPLWVVATLAFAGLVGPGLDAASLAWRSSEGCWVWMVVDGDTVRAVCPDDGATRIRLLGYDTPEMRGDCARETIGAYRATYHLRWALWSAREADLQLSGREDRFGRALGRLSLDGQDVAGTLVEAGLARPYGGGRRAGWCGA